MPTDQTVVADTLLIPLGASLRGMHGDMAVMLALCGVEQGIVYPLVSLIVADTHHQWWPVTAPNGERGWRCERCGLTAVRLTEKLWHAPCDAPPCAPSDNGTVPPSRRRTTPASSLRDGN